MLEQVKLKRISMRFLSSFFMSFLESHRFLKEAFFAFTLNFIIDFNEV